MITIWKTPIVATVEQVLKDLKLQLYGAGLLKEIKNTGSDLMCTCPFHANGKEHNPSCGVLLQQKVTKDKTYEAGTVHCYTCGYTADLPQFVADLLGLSSPVEGFKWLVNQYNYQTEERELPDLDMYRGSTAKSSVLEESLVKGLDEKSYGGNSALMKAFCDKAVPLCKKVECTFLMINQLRENIGNPYKPYKIPCGTAIAHACSQILWFTKGSLLDEKYKEVSSGYANPSGNLVSVKVEKNKVTKNDRRLQTYTLNYSTGVDEIKDTLDLAIMLGIISQAGAWFKATLKDGKEQKMQGFNGVQEFYYNDLEELEYLRKQVYEAGMV